MAQLGMMELQEGTESLVATVQDAGERAQRARAEARELLTLVQDSWRRLEGMWLGRGGWVRGVVRVRVRGMVWEGQGWIQVGSIFIWGSDWGQNPEQRGQMLIRVRAYLGMESESGS